MPAAVLTQVAVFGYQSQLFTKSAFLLSFSRDR